MIGTRIGTLIKWINIKICKKQTEEVTVIEGLDDFNELAKQMKVKLNKKQPFKKVVMLDNIGADLYERRIILGEKLFDRLNHSERLGVIAHELAHFKMNHALIQLLSILFAWALVHRWLPKEPESILVLIISWLMIIAAIFLVISISGYLCEYWADCVAIKYTKNKKAFITALMKVGPNDRWDIQYVDHPSINSRVSRLDNK